MPTHLDVLCGHYNDVLIYNQKALETDRRFLSYSDNPGIYLAYIIHDFHFAIYGATFLGQYKPAIALAEELITRIPEVVLRIESPPMADFLESYLTIKQHVLVRFGRWREIIAQVPPADRDLYCSVVAMMHYAKAVAHSALGHETAGIHCPFQCRDHNGIARRSARRFGTGGRKRVADRLSLGQTRSE